MELVEKGTNREWKLLGTRNELCMDYVGKCEGIICGRKLHFKGITINTPIYPILSEKV